MMNTIARISCVALIAGLSLAASEVRAQDCKMPDPPIFHAQGKILDFATLDDVEPNNEQQAVRDFLSFDGFDLDLQAPSNPEPIGPDDPPRHPPSPEEAVDNYLHPKHPGAQPPVPQSAWKRVNCVDEIEPFAWEIPALSDGDVAFRTLPEITIPTMSRATYVKKGHSLFPGEVQLAGSPAVIDSFANPPGTNMLPTIARNLEDKNGGEMINTLSSSKKRPYNLHDGDPEAERINAESPIDDLRYIMETIYEVVSESSYRDLLTRPDQISTDDLLEDAADASARIADAKKSDRPSPAMGGRHDRGQ